MFAIKHAAHVDTFRLYRLQQEMLKFGYSKEKVANTISFLEGTPGHPLIYDINNSELLFHMTTCSRAKPIYLVDHYAQLIKVSDTLISGTNRAQCTFDFKGRWPESLFQYKEFDPANSISLRGPQWLIDHQDILLSINERVSVLDLTHFTPLLNIYTSYPLL